MIELLTYNQAISLLILKNKPSKLANPDTFIEQLRGMSGNILLLFTRKRQPFQCCFKQPGNIEWLGNDIIHTDINTA